MSQNCPEVVNGFVVSSGFPALPVTLLLAQVPKFLKNIKLFLQLALCVLCNNLYGLRILYYLLFLLEHDIQNAQVCLMLLIMIFN
jgi:hypothetical protein